MKPAPVREKAAGTEAQQVLLLQGNAACARAAIAAGCRFYAGYPISPSSEIAETMSRILPRVGGKFIQMEDEIASLAAVIGASLTGMKAMTATSGPGFSLMQEHIGFAGYAEVPCVIVDVMRGGPSTGLPTSPSQGDVMQARWGTHGDHPTIALCASSPTEVFELTVRSFNFSERLRTPVILLLDEVVAHMYEKVDMSTLAGLPVENRRTPNEAPGKYEAYTAGEDGVPVMAPFGDGYRYHVTGLAHDHRGYPTQDPAVVGNVLRRLQEKIDRHRKEIVSYELLYCEDAEVVVFAYGIVAAAARQAVHEARQRGIRAGLFRAVTLWPFPLAELAAITEGARRIVVAEMNLGQLAGEVERAIGKGKRITTCFKATGETITPEEIFSTLQPEAAHV
jgi:2-oxoglutarate/2-oxoacid ferredoxin oxidoreductase subunit alpha